MCSLALTLAPNTASAQDAPAPSNEILFPNFVGSNEFLSPPNTTNLRKLRFLTTSDFPPFNFINEQGQMAGFQIEVAREICRALNISSRCQIKALEFENIEKAASNNTGDVLLAGHSMTKERLKSFDFSPSFLKFPGRFFAKSGTQMSVEIGTLKGEPIVGVMKGSAHEAYLKDYFKNIELKQFTERKKLQSALTSDEIKLAFDDGMTTSFWLNTPIGSCCQFIGEAYYSDKHFGYGLMMATPKRNEFAADIVEYGLHAITRSKKLEELYLRYFPISFY